MNGVMVWCTLTGAVLVEVPIVINGDRAQCVFVTKRSPLRCIGVFLDKHVGRDERIHRQPYRRRAIPVELVEYARERALDAIAALDVAPQTERMTSFAFAVDVAPVH